MALFQTSVLKQHLKLQDTATVDKAYKKYTKYFHNPTIQENIKNSKEEQYQAKFLDELFVNFLDYTLNPKPNFNITTEHKNQQGAGKADGAILKGETAIGVIELKGTNTKDLDNKKKAQTLQSQITQTEKEIDQMVYELYGLTEEEIKIVECS
ncbi:hypothetical protein [Formosa maritima]|uniref:Uncharacterized protein n=1 Tax=Formosa maritima TaxID=2592046 RepID=A0A5D0G393_9FLAO|nr:hypothetical protein [Formosa maritima]TYA53120.1 hypothetical protein FVF61_10695 [Formosa maritima]